MTNHNIPEETDPVGYLKKHSQERMTAEEREKLWQRIDTSFTVSDRKKRHRLYLYSGVAACIALFALCIPLAYFYLGEAPKQQTARQLLPVDCPESVEESVRLISSSGEELLFDGEEPEIVARDHHSEASATQPVHPECLAQNKIIVPPGKKSYLKLEDGSRIWINSGSTVVYPDRFAEGKREIFVSGEIFADVSRDEQRPFVVRTASLQVEVLGTEFNLSAYSEDSQQSVVLVSGKVKVNTPSGQALTLKPNSRLSLLGDQAGIDTNIDVHDYICWKDNFLVLNDMRFSDLALRLNRYYGCDIRVDTDLRDRVLSGKIDLKNSLEVVVQSLSISLKYDYEIQNNTINIQAK